MHDEVSETENIRQNLVIERLFQDGCQLILDSEEVFIKEGKVPCFVREDWRFSTQFREGSEGAFCESRMLRSYIMFIDRLNILIL